MSGIGAKNSAEKWEQTDAPPLLIDVKAENILLIDDLPGNLLVYQTILEELGQNLMVALSGEEALKLVLKRDFAVILLDVNMPTMDGFETASLIRQRKKSARTPIIFLTAFTDEVGMIQSYASGAVDYLPTPVVPEVLKAKVRVFVELSQMRRQAAFQTEERVRREAAEEADRRKDEFLGMLAHELRNPLGPIYNAVQLQKLLAPDDPRMADLRDIIDRQAKHMGRLIDDLLDATRVAHSKILLRIERCDLGQIVHQTIVDYRTIIEASSLQLNVFTPNAPVWISGDPTRLVQTIGNLLHNAHKFTKAGGVITVRLDVKKNERMATLTVTDTGIGIEPRMLSCIFDIFRQAEQGLDRSHGGLGLGLALVKGLVELHSGSVHATSAGLNKGAEFTIRLPIKFPENARVDESVSTTLPSSNKKYRVLVIEDNQDAAKSAQMLLHLEGHDVRTASTALTGLEAARDFHPQIILCDIGLPEIDGYQVVRKIRRDADLSSTYVIALTGYGRRKDQQQALDAGFDLHLTKPIDCTSLHQALALANTKYERRETASP